MKFRDTRISAFSAIRIQRLWWVAFLIVTAAHSGPARAVIINPGFEDDGEAFFISLSRFPIGWGGAPGGGGNLGHVSISGVTEGTYALALFIGGAGAAPGSSQFPVRLTQSVDLTAIDVLVFDAALAPELGWNTLVTPEFRIDGVVEWTQTSGGVFLDQIIDVSALSGIHEIEFRLSTTDTGAATAGHNFQIDNLREARPPPRPTSMRVEPLVIRRGLDLFTLTLQVSDPAVQEVHVNLGSAVTQSGSPAGVVVFRDDGTNGDAVAGDGLFSAANLGVAATSGSTGATEIRFVDMDYVYASAPTVTQNQDIALTLRHMDATLLIPSVTDFAPDVRATARVVSMVPFLFGVFPLEDLDRRIVAQRYYEFFPDDIDFLFIGYEFSTAREAYGTFSLIRNDVLGTGRQIIDQSAAYGSAGVLRGVVTTARSASRDFGVFNHELLHYWGVGLDASLDLGTGHWDAIVRPSTGFGNSAGNFVFDQLEFVSGSTYRAKDYPDADPGRFSDLELYLMGLVPDTDVVSPIDTLIAPVFQSQTTAICDPVCATTFLFTASGISSVSITDIIATHGVRSPLYPASPTNFRARFVVAYDRILSNVELAYCDHIARAYESGSSAEGLTFAEATGNRATIHLPEPTGALGLWAGVSTLWFLGRKRRPLSSTTGKQSS